MKKLLEISREEDLLSSLEAERFYAHGFALYNSGKMDEAIEVFRLLCMRAPFTYKFWFGLGACYQESRKYEEALRAWAMCALIEKENPMPHFHAAECCFSHGLEEDGFKALKEADRLSDESDPLRDKIALLKERRAS